MNKQNESSFVKNEEISYFDLLGLLKSNISLQEVSLTLNNEEKKYILKEEDYVLENIDEKNDMFGAFFGDSLTDKGKLAKNIKILQ